MTDYRFPSHPVWRFKTKNFVVSLFCERIHGYQYDGDDEDGETQRMIDDGEWHAFRSTVYVELRSEIDLIGRNDLYGNVYDNPPDFWEAHRDADPMNRNCSIMRAANGDNVVICHYFPDMVREAIGEARQELQRRRDAIPYIRESAL